MLDVFKSDAFSMASLTDAILKAPYKAARIGALALFREKGITTTSVVIEEKDGRMSLISPTPRGGPASTIGSQKRTARSFIVPHFERESTVMADEVQNVRAFGSENAVDSVQAIVNERLADLRAMHEVTLEHMRAGAVKGIILDADGNTVFNLFTEFGVSQQTATLDTDPTTDQKGKLLTDVTAAQRLIEEELGAEPISGYRALCGKTFFDGLRADASLVEVRKLGARNDELLTNPTGVRSLVFGGVTWEEYRGKNGATPFIADTEGYLFPEGSNIFATYFAPADYVETVNTIGLPIYAKIANDEQLNRWAKVHTQSNPLALCLRPRAVIKLTLA
jgi:hypothetical protein